MAFNLSIIDILILRDSTTLTNQIAIKIHHEMTHLILASV